MNSRHITSTMVGVAALALSACSESAKVTGPTPVQREPFAVTSLTADVNTPLYTGSCPHVLVFSATITTNAPGTVSYQWERSDGVLGPIEERTFSAAATETVTSDWELAGAYSGWQRVRILSPEPMEAEAGFSAVCNDDVRVEDDYDYPPLLREKGGAPGPKR